MLEKGEKKEKDVQVISDEGKDQDVMGKESTTSAVEDNGPQEAGAEGVPAEGSDPDELQRLLAEQTTRAQDYYDRLLRLQADFENFRRRTRQEKDDYYKYASEQLVLALLPVLDNFGLALAAEGDSIEGFKAGVEMIYKQLLDVLATEGVTPIQAVGEPFDPTRHEAVAQDDSGEHPANIVVEEFRRGYFLRDKVIRPSMVKVAVAS
jgi:molecular chaperone GrpE